MHNLLRRRDERGMALVSALLIGFIATMIVVTMMFVAFHDETSSAKNRSWGQALHVAESGVHQAIAYLQNTDGVVPSGTVTGTTEEGTYEYRIVAEGRNRYQVDAVGTVGTTGVTGASRRLRVILAPPVSFRYALFSLSDVTTKNNNNVCGDVYANTYVEVYGGDAVRASTSPTCPVGSTGYISLGNNSTIEGEAWSGGYTSAGRGIRMDSGAIIGGNAKASSSTPNCADDPTSTFYNVGPNGEIKGDATAWGTVSAVVDGTKSNAKCTAASETQPMPTYTFNAANYDPSTLHTYSFPADYTAFNNYIAANKASLSGTFYITGGGASYPVDLNGVAVGGDLTVVATESPIDASAGMSAANTNDKIVVLASWYSSPATSCSTNAGNPADCAISFKNGFDMDPSNLGSGDNTAVLLYAPNGPVAFKNSANFNGVVYANNIQIKNHMNVSYDPRLEQIVGFGTKTLDVDDWQECDPGPVTSTSCS
jgi:hypothetical protein